jgi:hypothetical protein
MCEISLVNGKLHSFYVFFRHNNAIERILRAGIILCYSSDVYFRNPDEYAALYSLLSFRSVP